MKYYIEPSAEQGKDFFMKLQGKGSFVMLNLMRFRTKALYKNENSKELSGEEAYQLYLKEIKPSLIEIGSEVLFQGVPNDFLIGPIEEKWDFILMVKHQSIEKFLEFSKSEIYLKNLPHQKAAIEDFRLLPVSSK